MKWLLENYNEIILDFFKECLYSSYSINCNGIEYKKRLIDVAVDWNKEELIFTFEKYKKGEHDLLPLMVHSKEKVYYTISHFHRFLYEKGDDNPIRYAELLNEDLDDFMIYIVKRSLKLECEEKKN